MVFFLCTYVFLWLNYKQSEQKGHKLIQVEKLELRYESRYYFLYNFSWNIFDLHFPLISIHVSDLFFFSFHWITHPSHILSADVNTYSIHSHLDTTKIRHSLLKKSFVNVCTCPWSLTAPHYDSLRFTLKLVNWLIISSSIELFSFYLAGPISHHFNNPTGTRTFEICPCPATQQT